MRFSICFSVLCAFVLIIAGVGCSSSGQGSGAQMMSSVPPKDDFKIVEGVTTEAELIAHFGNPDPNMVRDSNFGKTLVWSDSASKIRFVSLVPFAGFAGTPQLHTVSVTLRDGVVTHYSVVGQNAIQALAVVQ